MVSVLLFATVERFNVSRMRDFFLHYFWLLYVGDNMTFVKILTNLLKISHLGSRNNLGNMLAVFVIAITP